MNNGDDFRHLIFFCALIAMTVGAVFAAWLSRKARDLFLFVLVFAPVLIYQLQVTFLQRVWYRGTARGYEISVLDVLVIALLVVSVFRPKRGQGRLFWPAGMWPLVFYFGYCVVSSLFAEPFRFAWWEVFKIFRGILVVFAVAWYVRTERELGIVVLALACAVCFEGLASLKMRYVDHAYRISGTLGHPNSLSMYMCMAAPVLFAGALSKLPVWTRRFCIAGSAFAMVSVILTISRSGFVAWGIVMLGITVCCVSPHITLKKVFISLLVMACVGGAIGYSWKTLQQRLVVETDLSAEMDKDSLGRGSYFRLAKLIIEEHFWGVGLNNWSWYVTNEYQAKDNPDPKLQYKPYSNTDDAPDIDPVYGNETAQAAPAHNLGALTLGELGWAGAFLFTVAWLRWFDMGQRFIWKRSPEVMHRLGTGVFFGLLAVFLQSLTEWEFRQQPIFYLFHVYLGILAAMYRVRRKPKPIQAATASGAEMPQAASA